jgi:uncharacterized repeat protein (TIGR01451 family)
MSFTVIRQFFRDNPRMWFAFAAAVIIAGTAAAWMFSGFTVGTSEFFAATPSKSILQVTCSGSTALLTWNIPPDANSNSIEKNVNGQGWTYVLQGVPVSGITTVTDMFVPTTQYRHKSGAGVASDIVQCPLATPVPTPTPASTPLPTPIPTPTPAPSATVAPAPTQIVSAGAVLCAPDSQTIVKGGSARVDAVGGASAYSWTSTGGGIQQDGGADFVVFSYLVAGTKTVTVRSGLDRATCAVVVEDASSVAVGEGALLVAKRARNMSRGEIAFQPSIIVQPGETVQFDIQLRSDLPQGTLLRFTDVLPAGMSYQAGSTILNDAPASDGIITGQGLHTGALPPGQIMTIRWSAIANQTDLLRAVNHETHPLITVIGGSEQATAEMVVTVVGTGTGISSGGSPVGQVQTGPGDAVVLALMAAAAVTVLYTGYTRSPSFRRHEVEQIRRDQGPLDFRS